MSWFNLGWRPEDAEIVRKWRTERGTHVKYDDETIADPQADAISWVFGYPITKQVNRPAFGDIIGIVPKEKKKTRKRKPLTSSQRQLIFETRGTVCQDCGEKNERLLQIHHVDEDATNNNIDNLIVLCYLCHKKRHARKITAT